MYKNKKFMSLYCIKIKIEMHIEIGENIHEHETSNLMAIMLSVKPKGKKLVHGSVFKKPSNFCHLPFVVPNSDVVRP